MKFEDVRKVVEEELEEFEKDMNAIVCTDKERFVYKTHYAHSIWGETCQGVAV